MKYKVLKAWQGVEVGEVVDLETGLLGKLPLLVELMVAAGFIEEVDERWKPKKGDEYFYVDKDGQVGEYHWVGFWFDNILFDFGNCFRTREEAEAAAERVKEALKKV